MNYEYNCVIMKLMSFSYDLQQVPIFTIPKFAISKPNDDSVYCSDILPYLSKSLTWYGCEIMVT